MPVEKRFEGLIASSFRTQFPRRLAADFASLTERYGRFSAQPFERGFGNTVGNSLRRALLSSIEGAAITAVKIEGVEHEFSSINGVVEDATDVILNLKQVPFKLHSTEPKTLRISKKTAGEVTAADIQVDADVEILDPSVHIATVCENGSLKIEMRLKRGRGYVSADKNFDEDLSPGYIPIDSVHTPVKKVHYNVKAARLGENTEFDKLTIEVWTDGSVKPEDSIGLAAKLIKDHMSIFINFEEDTDDLAYAKMDHPAAPRYDQLDRFVDELELSVRSYHCLKNADIRTIRDLVQRTESEMLAIKNFGKNSLNEIREVLNGMGLDFGMAFNEQGNPISEAVDEIVDLPEEVDALLPTVREVIHEESTARRYVAERYRSLVERKYVSGLSESESDELEALSSTLDAMDEPYYDAVIRRLRHLVDHSGT